MDDFLGNSPLLSDWSNVSIAKVQRYFEDLADRQTMEDRSGVAESWKTSLSCRYLSRHLKKIRLIFTVLLNGVEWKEGGERGRYAIYPIMILVKFILIFRLLYLTMKKPWKTQTFIFSWNFAIYFAKGGVKGCLNAGKDKKKKHNLTYQRWKRVGGSELQNKNSSTFKILKCSII